MIEHRRTPSMMLTPHAVAAVVGGKVHGNKVSAPGPGHSRRDRSLSILVSPDVPGGLLVHSFAGDDAIEIKKEILLRLGLSSPAPWTAPAKHVDTNHAALATTIWSQAVSPVGTPVEAYLKSRGLPLADALRWHPACPFDRTRSGAMVAVVTNVLTGQPQAIHRTALTTEGRKREIEGRTRWALGPTSDGVIRLWPDDAVTVALGIGEGIETTLSINQVEDFRALPVWCAVSADGVGKFPVLPGVEGLVVAVDRGKAGIQAGVAVRDAWTAAGRDVTTLLPRRNHGDLNDLVMEVARVR